MFLFLAAPYTSPCIRAAVVLPVPLEGTLRCRIVSRVFPVAGWFLLLQLDLISSVERSDPVTGMIVLMLGYNGTPWFWQKVRLYRLLEETYLCPMTWGALEG